MPRCPSCKGEVEPRDQNAAFPFCSPRCRAVDLGRWYIGEYRVPGPPAQPDDGERRERDPDEPEQ